MSTQPVLASRQNPLCKLVRSLHAPKGRREQGLFLADGRNAVEAAIAAEWPIRKLLCAQERVLEWQRLAPRIDIQAVAPEILEYLSDAQTNPGVLALCALPQPIAELKFEKCLLVLDGISDPGNAGTVIRSADAAGAAGVLSAANSADPFSPKAVRASAGSVFHLPPIVLEDNSARAIIKSLQQQNTPLIIAAGDAEVSCFEYSWPQQCALVLGHETRGVTAPFEKAATARVKVPIYGQAESLNVATAGTVLLYTWRSNIREPEA